MTEMFTINAKFYTFCALRRIAHSEEWEEWGENQ
jgi:hypothetical protein